MTQDLLFPEFSPTEHDAEGLARLADEVLSRRAVGKNETRADELRARRIDTPVGSLVALTTERGLASLEFVAEERFEASLGDVEKRYGRTVVTGPCEYLDDTQRQLERYFAGELQRFTMALDVRGTPFQLDVWGELRRIPYGAMTSYAEIADAIGKPKAMRAVGAANGRNRIAIVLPCHRVVGADRTLTGYAGGLWRKRRLLELEGATAR